MKPQTDWKNIKSIDKEDPLTEPEEDINPIDDEDSGKLIFFGGHNSESPERIIDFLYQHFSYVFLVSTNFRITANIYRAIKNVDGIEGIQVLTPYRMRIAIGDLFDIDEVRVSVNRQINGIFSHNTRQ